MVTVPVQEHRQAGPPLWGRLLWKEWREGWPILAVGVALPLLTLPMSKREGWTAFDLSVLGLVAILVTLWAADRAQRTGLGRTDTRLYLPASTATRWLFIYLVPTVVPVLIGLSVGWMHLAWHPGITAVNAALAAGILYLLSAFLLSTVLTAIYTSLPAVLAGVVWAFIAVDSESPARQIPLFAGMIAACLVVAVLWEGVIRQRVPLPGRIVLAIMLLVVVVYPWVLQSEWRPARQAAAGARTPFSIYNRHDYLRVSIHYLEKQFTGKPVHLTDDEVELAVYDRGEEQAQIIRIFPQTAQPLGFIDRSHVLVAQQPPESSTVNLLSWDIRSNTVMETGSFTVVRDLLAKSSGACLTADGRYLAIAVRNVRRSSDLWIADLLDGHTTLAMANVVMDLTSFSECAWTPDLLYIGNYDGQNAVIDLRTMRGRSITPADLRRIR
jgi:hypothetical protein